MIKANSNYETNRRKISYDCPFKKDTEKSHLTSCSMILRGTSTKFKYLAKTKPRTKLFLPIGQWPRPVRMMKKTGCQKSCWTVPLRQIFKKTFNEIKTHITNFPTVLLYFLIVPSLYFVIHFRTLQMLKVSWASYAPVFFIVLLFSCLHTYSLFLRFVKISGLSKNIFIFKAWMLSGRSFSLLFFIENNYTLKMHIENEVI